MDPETEHDPVQDRVSGSSDDRPPELARPPRVADHEVLKSIGRGSYGGVYLARSAMGQLRAVKVVWRSRFSSERPYEREFHGIRQFEPISRSHPGVVEILHIGRDPEAGCFYYVMELADPVVPQVGSAPRASSAASYEPRTLASDLKRRGRLPLGDVLKLGIELAGALEHIHRHRLIHRDVKPSNVIFVGGRAKLADIGLITGADEARSFVGTEGFIPPEGPGTPQADIFALGRLLYEAATGKDRCEFPNLPDDLDDWSSAERTALLELNEVLARACAPRAAQRHDSAERLAADLELLASGRSIRRAYGVGRWSKRAAMLLGLIVLVTPLLLWRNRERGESGPPAAQQVASIAVLPFVNRSASAEDEYFAEGLGDELLNLLARIDGLRVAARTSASQFKGKDTAIPEIGRALNVATVLEGSVRKAGSRVRISVQLVNVADGYHLWSQTYDRSVNDLFAVQDDIAQAVVSELRSKLIGDPSGEASRRTEADVARAAKGRGTDPEAHRLFLLARFMIDRSTAEETLKAIEYLEDALERDPQLAFAWAELSRAYSNQAIQGWAPTEEAFERSRQAAARALALGPDIAEGHSAMGWVQVLNDWDWTGAERSFARALELEPRNPLVLRRAGALAQLVGRVDQAIELCEKAVEQDPLNSGSYSNLGNALVSAGRYADAERAYRRARDLAPYSPYTSSILAQTILAQGRSEEALEEALREPDEGFRDWALAIVHHAAGRRAESDAALQRLVTGYGADSAYQIAEVHGARGEADAAFEWLERALEYRDAGLPSTKMDLNFRSLHADPRWGELMRKLGFAG